jgi:FkbM family methyltransferase
MRLVKVETLTLRIADRQPAFWDAVEHGRWEPLTLETIRALCGPGTTFLDGGAWVGPTALMAAATGAQVLAIEADPAALDQLHDNLAANPELARRIAVLPRALSAQAGDVRLGTERKPGSSMSSTLLPDAASAWTVRSITPGELAAQVATEDRLVFKLDIEGGEYALAPSLGPLIDRAHTAVLLSTHPALLREAQGAEALPEATHSVLSAFTRFAAYRREGSAWLPVSDPLAPEELRLAERTAQDWLFLRDVPAPVHLLRATPPESAPR